MNKNNILSHLFSFFNKGNERSQAAKKNIAASVIIKGLNIAIGLLLVPLTINYLNPTKYGIWITLSSLISWFSFFDIGLGNGLRNKLAESIAIGKHKLARIYVSTAYAVIALIVLVLLVLFSFSNSYINWNKVLNADCEIISYSELSTLVQILFSFFCFQLIFKLISTVLTANQKPAKASFFDLIGQFLALILIFILTKTTKGSLLYLGLVMSASPVFSLLISSIWLYTGKYKRYCPTIHLVDFKKSKVLMGLGLKFFVIQIAAILLYQTNNIIIAQLFGPSEVTPYNIAFKYFSIITMIFSIIITPFWSAFTQAWVTKEVSWIRNIIKKLIHIWVILFFLGLIMLFFSNTVYKIWIGEKVVVSISISLFIYMWMIINTWNNLFSNFLNGVGKIKLQFYIGIISSLINIPMAIFFGKNIGIEGILIANIISVTFGAIIYPIQYKKIISNHAIGIWNE